MQIKDWKKKSKAIPNHEPQTKKPKEKETIDSRTQDKRKMGHRFRVVYQSSR